jgi:glycosyltransferase involved in cell wall biosynthesis
MSQPLPNVSCVLPALNEQANLPRVVEGLSAALGREAGFFEIIVVDDGSRDRTPQVLERLVTRFENLRVLTHTTTRGYGAALRTGFESARLPYVIFTDADGQFDPGEISLLLGQREHADIVVGYRIGRQDSRLRRLLSWGYNLLVRRLLGVGMTDINCAFKLVRRDVLPALDLRSSDFCVNAELALRAKREGLQVIEVPVSHRARLGGRSSIRFFHIFQTLGALLRLRLAEL